jgi:hypothetical protein
MKKYDYIGTLVAYIQNIPKDVLQTRFLILLGTTLAIIIGGTFYIRTTSTALVTQIKNLQKQAKKARDLSSEFQKLEAQEAELAELMQDNTSFGSLKSYFEQFIKQHSLAPEAGWAETATTSDSMNDKFEEEQLTATFKSLNTQKLVELIQKLSEDRMMHIGEISVNREGKSITLTVILAAKKFIQSPEE